MTSILEPPLATSFLYRLVLITNSIYKNRTITSYYLSIYYLSDSVKYTHYLISMQISIRESLSYGHFIAITDAQMTEVTADLR